jgi:ubiquinone/menaquinone biosynthesis C-methylase UbiE
MEIKRKPFEGVFNIVRFNWQFYVIAAIAVATLLFFKNKMPFADLLTAGIIVAIATVMVSLAVSYYVYDVSGLYRLSWLNGVNAAAILNINAGFDETSTIVQNKFPQSQLTVCDFYNQATHTEVSIKRARQAYPPYPGTLSVQTNKLPFLSSSFTTVLAILSAHEIRDENERIQFFTELNRVLQPQGQIFVTEHLRNGNNFLAYTIGFFHFHSKKTWLHTFKQANLILKKEIKATPFITTFVLEKNGTAT